MDEFATVAWITRIVEKCRKPSMAGIPPTRIFLPKTDMDAASSKDDAAQRSKSPSARSTAPASSEAETRKVSRAVSDSSLHREIAVPTADAVTSWRTVHFWKLASRMIFDYRMMNGKKKEERDWDMLHERYAPQVLELALKLRGLFVKLGQQASTMSIVPSQYREKLEVLQKGVPAKPLAEVRGIIERSMGRGFDEMFQSFDELPIGSASVGQVHRARLHDGREVVVKVQYPEVRELFASDFDQVIAACKFWDTRVIDDLKEARRHHVAETDFRREARIMDAIASNAQRAWGHRVVIPRSVEGMVSQDVLVMTLLPGYTLLDALTRMGRALAHQLGMSLSELKDGMATPGAISQLRLARAYGTVWLHSMCSCVAKCTPGGEAPPPVVEVKKILRLLTHVLAQQVLDDGLFTSDPHPGNVMILPDGRLGLIDFGQAKELTTKQRIYLCRTVVAVATQDTEEILELAKESPFKTKYNTADAMVRYTSVVWEGKLEELDELAAIDPVVQSDPEYLMVRRTVLMCHGLCAVIGTTLNVAKEWEPVARRVLREEGIAVKDSEEHPWRARLERCTACLRQPRLRTASFGVASLH